MVSHAAQGRGRFVLVIPALTGGGSERVLTAIASYLAGLGHEVTVVTIRPPHTDAYPLDSGIRRASIGVDRVRYYQVLVYARVVRRLRATIRKAKPSAVVAFIWKANILTLIALGGTRIPVVISERSIPERENIRAITQWLRKLLYRRAHALVVMTTRAKRQFHSIVGERTSVEVIPNFVDARAIDSPELIEGTGQPRHDEVTRAVLKRRRAGRKLILAMGRLHAVKGFDTLILAYQRIAEKLPDWDLVVLGEGAERSRLEALRDRLGLENRVFLPGRTEEPHRALSAGEIFVLSSRAEGFGLALIEAMAAGLAVISTDCPVGPPEIITDGEDGILVPVDDPSALAGAIQELAQNNERRAALSRKAVNVRERFARSSVLAHWGRFLEGFVQATTDGRDISNDARTR